MDQYFFSNNDWQQSELAILQRLAQEARVFGIGESAHFVHEFNLNRIFLSKILIEKYGFTHVVLEMGEIESDRLNPWLQGRGVESDFAKLAGPATQGLYGEFLLWLRSFNLDRRIPISLIGPDLPNSMDLSCEIEALADYLKQVDPDAISIIEDAQLIAAKIKNGGALVASRHWEKLDRSDQALLSANLTRISHRMSAMEASYIASSDRDQYKNASRRIKTACAIEYMIRAISELFSGSGLPGDTSIRELHTAKSLLEMLKDNDKMRVIYLAHNCHIQKEPVFFDDKLLGFPAGYYLSRSLGNAYKAMGLTHTASSVPEMNNFPIKESPVGFTVEILELEAPPIGSVESYIIDRGLKNSTSLIDLYTRDPAIESLNKIRAQGSYVLTPVQKSFDAILAVPSATIVKDLLF